MSPFASPWREALGAARANLLPGLVLQAFASALVAAYYLNASVGAALDDLAAVKVRYGYLYSALATALFGGAIPFAYMRLHPRSRAATPPSHAIFYLAFWAYKGVEVDVFYRFQGWLFGTRPDAVVIAKKVILDQFVYCVFWSLPWALLAFGWKDAGFSLGRLRSPGLAGFWKKSLPAAVLGTWSVWIPAVTVIYSLPSALQIPLFNLVLCFYALLFAALTARNPPSARAAAGG